MDLLQQQRDALGLALEQGNSGPDPKLERLELELGHCLEVDLWLLVAWNSQQSQGQLGMRHPSLTQVAERQLQAAESMGGHNIMLALHIL